MLKKKFILIAILLMTIGTSLFSQQLKPFTNSPSNLIFELNEYFGITKEPFQAIISFSSQWDRGDFNDSSKRTITFCVYKMHKKGLKRPLVLKFLSTINMFSERKQSEDSFLSWMNTMDELVEERSIRKFQKFLNQSHDLLSSQILSRSASRYWKYRGGDFYFFTDTVLKLKFTGGDLICTSGRDSSEIFQTNGTYYPHKNYWRGENGQLNWKRVGKSDVMSAVFSHYFIYLKRSQYSADSVVFTDKKYFKVPMLGRLTEKIHGSKTTKRTSYPRFYSYQKNYVVDTLFPSIKYVGGINVQGSRIICDASKNDEAVLIFHKDSLPFVNIYSQAFVLYNEKINSKRARILILFGNDSISHPGVQMKFDNHTRELELNRRAKGIAPSPFYDSYHQLDMYCDAVYWNMDSLKLDFGSLKSIGNKSEAVFESANYYSAYEYYRQQGIDPVNPLIILKRYSDIYNTKTVHLGLLTDYIKKPKEQAANMLFNLAEKGFVNYDVENGTAIIMPRLFNFLNAKAGLQDYDVIKFKSETQFESSATIDLTNFDLFLRGIDQVHLSDSQRVQIIPQRKQIILQKNRNFQFAGLIKGGFLDFNAGDCMFDYDSFKLDMPQINSLSFKVRNREITPENPNTYIQLESVLSDLSGHVLIDDPANKSGNQSFPEYPIFHNKKEAYVYYEDSLIMNGQLKKDKFYYMVEPFTIDSLDNFSVDGIGFTGHLVSDSIFPILHEDLTVMNDYSLGFHYKAPDNGVAIYRAKGNYFEHIELSNEGLFGHGRLAFLNSMAYSSKFSFYPDSVIAIADTLIMNKDDYKYNFPDVIAERVHYHWLPDIEFLTIQTTDSLMQMFNQEARMKGKLYLSPSSLKGEGLFLYENFRLSSNEFYFSNDGLKSDTTDFELFTKDTHELAFSTNDYQTSISFSSRKGNFKSNGLNSVLNFPFNNYVSTMDEIEWNMDESELVMKNNLSSSIPGINEMSREDLLDTDLSGSKFTSLRPDQDSLSFYSLKARYDMSNYILYAEDVKYINVANAAIFPSDGKLTIKQNAVIPTITDAWIISDVDNRYHSVYNADVNIFSKNHFIANGSYDYIDANKTPQHIKLNTITVDTTGKTYALGIVPEDELFFLNPHFFFSGNVKWTSDNPFVRFYGGFRLNQQCDFSEAVWVKFDTIVNPEEVCLPITDQLVDLNNNRLDVGLFYSINKGVLYSKVFKSKDNINDRNIIKARGVVQFNSSENRFEVGPKNKLKAQSMIGNQLNFDLTNCMLSGSGALKLTDDLGETKLRVFGEYYHSIDEDTTSFRALLGFDFKFDKKTLKVMTDTIQSMGLFKIRMDNDYFKMVMTNAANPELEQEIISDLDFYAALNKNLDQYPDKLILTDVFLQWDPKDRIYKSHGKIGLGFVNGTQINTYVDGLIVIDRKRSNNFIQIYLEINYGLWYYFKFENKLMQVVSSDSKFNKQLSKIDQSKRIIKNGPLIKYEFVISEIQKKNEFLRKYQIN